MAVGFSEFDVEREREKLRKLSDAELIREAARYMCSPAYFGKPPRDEFVIGLEADETRREDPF